MAKRKRSKTHKVSIEGIKIIEREINSVERQRHTAEMARNLDKMDDLDHIKTGIQSLARRLDLVCSCREPRGSARAYCRCRRQTSTKSTTPRTRGTMLSGCRLDLSGNCRDKAGKFVPVRNCTGRGPATKRKPKRKPKKKAAKRR